MSLSTAIFLCPWLGQISWESGRLWVPGAGSSPVVDGGSDWGTVSLVMADLLCHSLLQTSWETDRLWGVGGEWAVMLAQAYVHVHKWMVWRPEAAIG